MAKKNKDTRSGYVYSTNPDFVPDDFDDDAVETPPPSAQTLYVSHDRKLRKGKTVTLVEGFVGQESDLSALAALLKNKCGVGGTAKDGEIVIQGELRDKVAALLNQQGYKVKLKGG